MNHFLLKAMLLLMLTPQNQKLPDEFYKIPEPIREQATIIVSGVYGQGRTPCMFRPDGTRVWALDTWIEVRRVYRGEVASKFIRINPSMLPDSEYVNRQLKRGQRYLALLRPDEEKTRAIKTKDGISFWNSLRNEEIIAIVELIGK